MTTPVSKVVNVTISSSPTFPKRKGFGLLLIVGKSARLPVGNRIRFYNGPDDVAADFSETDEEYRAAQLFFMQSPRPTEVAIGRRFDTGAPGELLCSVNYEKDVAKWQAIVDGALKINIDGGAPEVLSGIDLSGAANLNAVASLIQAKLQAVSPGAVCAFDGTRFAIRSGSIGETSTVDYSTAPDIDTDLGPLLGSRAEDKGLKSAGVEPESIVESLNALQDYDPSWYGVSFTKEVTTEQIKEVAAWTQARTKIFGFTTKDSDVLDLAATADIGSFLKANLYDRTFGIWDDNDPYQIVSAFARAFTVNFNAQNSTITLKFKTLPGTTPTNLTESQRKALVAKNLNYYTYFGDSAMLAEGAMSSGTFFDERHGLDWLQNAIETNVFGYLYTRPTKVPQTDRGVTSLVQQTEKALSEGVNNGLLAPGVWNGDDLGEIQSGAFLPKGYYVYAQPVAQQNQSDREARKAPPIQVIAKGAGAIHFVDIGVTFER